VPLLEEAYSALVVALQAAVAAFLVLAPEEVCLVLLPEDRVAVQASSAAPVPPAAEEVSSAAQALPAAEEASSAAQALRAVEEASSAALPPLAPEEASSAALPPLAPEEASSAALVPLAAEEASLAALAPLAAEEAFSAALALLAAEEAFSAALALPAAEEASSAALPPLAPDQASPTSQAPLAPEEASLATRVPQAAEEAFSAALVLRAVGEASSAAQALPAAEEACSAARVPRAVVGEASSEVLLAVEGAVFLELLHHKVEVYSAGQLPLEDLAWVHPPVVACLVQPHLEVAWVAWVASQMPRRRNLFAWSSPEGWRSSIQSLAEPLETDRVLPWLLHRVAECGCLLATSWHTAILFQPIFKLLRRPTIHRHSTQCSMWIK